MENSKIEWCHHTFNCWRGCTKISPGCSSCYADTLSKRNPKTLGIWGPKGTRVVAAESAWKEPLKWEALFRKAIWNRNPDDPLPIRPRVFCASLADVFEDWQGPMLDSKGERLCIYKPNGGMLTTAPYAEEPPANCRWMTMQDVRNRLFRLIDATPNLDWLILTKRPENIRKMMPPSGVGDFHDKDEVCTISLAPRDNLWLGTSPCNQATAEELIPELLKCRDLAEVLLLSCEPLIGPIDFFYGPEEWGLLSGIGLCIIGGESGHGARPCDLSWIRSLIAQCKAANVACFVKQLGKSYFSGDNNHSHIFSNDKKGGAMEEWPIDLRIRDLPC